MKRGPRGFVQAWLFECFGVTSRWWLLTPVGVLVVLAVYAAVWAVGTQVEPGVGYECVSLYAKAETAADTQAVDGIRVPHESREGIRGSAVLRLLADQREVGAVGVRPPDVSATRFAFGRRLTPPVQQQITNGWRLRSLRELRRTRRGRLGAGEIPVVSKAVAR